VYLSTRYLPDLRLSRVKHNASAEGPGTAKPKLRRFSQFLVALFRIFGNATGGLSEDPKTDQVAQWRWRFFGSREKKTTGGLRLETLFHRATV